MFSGLALGILRPFPCALLVWASLLPGAPAMSDAPQLKLGKALEGVIEDADTVVSTETLAKGYTDAPVLGTRYSLNVSRAGSYHIDMISPYFDAYLVLRDGEGKLVAEDDDGLASTHALIEIELAEGSYTLDACALHGQRGQFELEFGKGQVDPERGVEWTDWEIDVRIAQVFPDQKRKKIKVVKSKNYIIFTDGGAGKKFGKILDKEIYEDFRELFPFEKPERFRLLPIYLFNTRDRYIDFLMRTFGWERGQASNTGGVAFRDFYSTSYTSPRDTVHWHECAHQLMSNVLGLSGGGSWFQEGVAEYYQDKIAKVNRYAETRNAIRSDQTLLLREMLGARSLLFSAGEDKKGAGGARGAYGQAASLILFLKEGDRKDEFDTFLHLMGAVPRNDIKAIEKVLDSVYQMTIDDLELEWREYFTD